jgi:hypothetical protein
MDNGASRPSLWDLSSPAIAQPHVFASGANVWVTAKMRFTTLAARKNPADYYFPTGQKGYWEYWMSRLDGDHWTQAFPLPNSKGRSSARVNAVWDAAGDLWMAWPTDGRISGDYHRPLRQQVYAAQIRAGAVEAAATVASSSESVDQRQAESHRARRLPSPHGTELGPRR